MNTALIAPEDRFADFLAVTGEAVLITTRHGAPLAASEGFRKLARTFAWKETRLPRAEEVGAGALAPAVYRSARAVLEGADAAATVETAEGEVCVAGRLSEDGECLLWRFTLDRGAVARRLNGAQPFAGAAVGVAVIDGDPVGDPGLAGFNDAFRALFPQAAVGRSLDDLADLADVAKLREFLAARADGARLTLAPAGRPDASVVLSASRSGADGPLHLFAHEAERVAGAGDHDGEQGLKLQALGQLAGGVAHDFNNVLQAIMGFCDLLLARHPVADPSHADLSQIKQNALRAGALVRQLLAFSRAQDLQPKAQHLADVLVDIADLLRRLLGAKVNLRLTHGADVPPAKFDDTQLEMAIMNLAVNARDAMPEGGSVEIATGRRLVGHNERAESGLLPPGDYAVIRVSDTGEGMEESVRARAFEPFFTTKDVGKGTGLGLSTVYGIVKQSGGHIFLDSKKGEGTVFRIYLPAADLTVTQTPKAAASEAPRPVDLTGRGRILLVEDEEAVRAFTSRALKSRGYEVTVAEDGQEALDVIRGGLRPDLVVSDVMMPAMDGPAFVVAAGDLLADARILFVSGYGADAVRSELADDPRIRFLPKPFSLKDLAAAVKAALVE